MSKKDYSKEIQWLLRDKHHGKVSQEYEEDVSKLLAGEHISHIIGWTPFLGCKVDLTAKPLVPRPETEYWTEKAIREIKKSEISNPEILDIFCGSGCIGLAVLKHVPGARVAFADINPAYFIDIRKSISKNNLNPRRASFHLSDTFSGLKNSAYDFILANPPYIPHQGRKVAKSVLENEPAEALFGGKDGLGYIRKLIAESSKHLKPRGKIFIEFDPPQKKEIAGLASRQAWKAEFLKDQYGRLRCVVLEK